MSPPTMIDVLHDAVLHARQHVVHQADVPEQVEIRHHRGLLVIHRGVWLLMQHDILVLQVEDEGQVALVNRMRNWKRMSRSRQRLRQMHWWNREGLPAFRF